MMVTQKHHHTVGEPNHEHMVQRQQQSIDNASVGAKVQYFKHALYTYNM